MNETWQNTFRRRWSKLVAQKDPRVWISVINEAQLEDQLVAIEAKLARGESLPLIGLTFAIKDNIDLEGLPTTAGCPDFAFQPQQDAFAVALLKGAGAIAIGKTNMDQFATGLVGTRSPHGACPNFFNPEYISGGSSSGSAVAVARDEVDFALGTDTAGSGRVPAAYNGLIGYKPTRGVISTNGVVPACRTLDCVSVFSRRVDLADRVAQVLRAIDPRNPFSRHFHPTPFRDVDKFRFGVPKEITVYGDPEASRLFQEAVSHLEQLGGEKRVIDDSQFREAAALLYQGPWVAERYAAVGEWIERHSAAVDSTVRQIILGGRDRTAVAAFQAMYQLAEIKRRTEETWRQCDCLVFPTVTTSPRIDEVSANPIELNSRLGEYNNFVNLLDLAAVTVPTGGWSHGPGFGVNLIGPAFSDDFLLQLAARLQGETLPFRQKTDTIALAVVGAHLRGQPLNSQLDQLNARFLKQTCTAPQYRLYSLPNTTPPKPGLVRANNGGSKIEVEVYEMTPNAFGKFVAAVPPPLCIGNAILEDGCTVKSFLCEPAALEGATEITAFGGWRSYLKEQHRPLA
jgi:allophanate hydrolase